MSKKYVPSGYQIININVENKTSGNAFYPETDDEKLLEQLLVNGCKKPILLRLVTLVMGEFLCFPVMLGGSLKITWNGGHEEIYADGSGKITWEEVED